MTLHILRTWGTGESGYRYVEFYDDVSNEIYYKKVIYTGERI
jgi:hypothetical protein